MNQPQSHAIEPSGGSKERENPFSKVAPTSAYIHVPFCASRCGYCDFFSCKVKPGDFDRYADLICREIDLTKEELERKNLVPQNLKTVYFGGGTPSFLPVKHLTRILSYLRMRFSFASEAEITLEANPAANLPSKLPMLREAGFNRLSLGLQTFNPELLRRIGRRQQPEVFEKCLRAAFSAGFRRLTVDLMFGLPGQKLQDVVLDATRLATYPMEQISAYSLELYESTPLGKSLLNHPELLPSPEAEREMYHWLVENLPRFGFTFYEISNAARTGGQSRHNLVYWNGEPYLAFGPAASSYYGGERRIRSSNWDSWVKGVTEATCGEELSNLEEKINFSDSQREYMMLQLRLYEGLSYEKFKAIFHEEPERLFAEEIRHLSDRQLIRQTSTGIALTTLGFDLANQAFMAFV